MTRLFIGLTLLLLSFLSALENLDGVRDMAARASVYRWVPELVLAAAAVAAFMQATSLRRRLLFPRRGMRLLAAGIAVYALGLAVATGLLLSAADKLALEQGSVWSGLPDLVAGLHAQPVFLAAQLLLVVGAFRALTNMVPPSEFEADY